MKLHKYGNEEAIAMELQKKKNCGCFGILRVGMTTELSE
jgi:hypothetical protein